MKASEMMESWFENSKVAMQPARELSEITARAFEKANEQNMAFVKDYMDFSLRGWKLLGATRDPRALVEQQVELAQEAGQKMFAVAEAYTKLATEMQAEFSTWTEKTAETAVAKAEEATEAAVANAEKALQQAA